MRLLVINPVGHTKWDEQDKRLYESFAPHGTEIVLVSLPKGPPSVETSQAHREVIPLIIAKANEMSGDFDAIAVNCFLDPAVDSLRRTTAKPAIGPCEASLAIAYLAGSRIGVVSVHNKALWLVRERLRELDQGKRVKSVVSIPMGVLELDEDWDQTGRRVIEKSEELKATHDVDVVCLGCTGLAGLAPTIRQAVGIPVIDPIGATVKMALAAVDLSACRSSATEKQSEQLCHKQRTDLLRKKTECESPNSLCFRTHKYQAFRG